MLRSTWARWPPGARDAATARVLDDLSLLVGLDIDSSARHSTAVDAHGRTLLDRPCSPIRSSRPSCRLLTGEQAPMLLVVDHAAASPPGTGSRSLGRRGAPADGAGGGWGGGRPATAYIVAHDELREDVALERLAVVTRAARLLTTTTRRVNEIALFVGYDDANYFVKVFRAHFGMTPTKYRAVHEPSARNDDPADQHEA